MTSLIEKFIKKLSAKDKEIIVSLIESILLGEYKNLDYKKLKDQKDCYRVRKGPFRVIFKREDNEIVIISVERRSEKTYRAL